MEFVKALCEVSQQTDSHLEIGLTYVVSDVLMEVERYFIEDVQDLLHSGQDQAHTEEGDVTKGMDCCRLFIDEVNVYIHTNKICLVLTV